MDSAKRFLKRTIVQLTLFCWAVSVPAGWVSGAGIVPVEGSMGMVVAGHPEAANIGLAVLEAGGNAMDAAVATSFALGVAEPYGSGMGGKCAILYYEAKSGKSWFVDGLDAAGAELDKEALLSATSAQRAQGGLGVGVPGQVAAMELAHRKWGQLPWRDIVLPSAKLAEDGFLFVPGMQVFFERRLERIQSHPETSRLYLAGGVLPEVGQRLANPDLAKTLLRVAEEGRCGFYHGEVAAKIVAAVKAGGGSLTIEDFNNYEARLLEPIWEDWQGYRILSSPPPTKGGATVLLAMKLLEHYQWEANGGLRTPENLDGWSRALRYLYPIIEKQVADSPEAVANWQELMRPGNLDVMRAEAFAAAEESALAISGALSEARPDECTTHFVVADQYGNLASVTQSLSHHFGSGVIAPGTGVILNNTLKNFSSWDPSGINGAAPGKRPTSTIAPSIVLKDGRPVLGIGLPGGQRIPTTLIEVLLDTFAFGRGMGEAIGAPRFHLRRSWSEKPDSKVIQLEQAMETASMEQLRERGWQMEVSRDSEFFGGVSAIEISPEGTFTGWADHRRTNHAAGF